MEVKPSSVLIIKVVGLIKTYNEMVGDISQLYHKHLYPLYFYYNNDIFPSEAIQLYYIAINY